MKEAMDLSSAPPAGDVENFANRKLIRPALRLTDHNHGNHNSNHNSNHMKVAERRERTDRHDRPERGFDRGDRGDRSGAGGGGRKTAPPEQTNAENFYYQKQMQSKTPMVI